MSPEMTMDIGNHENDDSTHHYLGHVNKDNVEGKMVEDYPEKEGPIIFSKSETAIP